MALASILFSLEWWLDSKQRDRQAEIRRLRESEDEDDDGDDPPTVYAVPDLKAAGAERYACRLCGEESAERAFCLRCLADTMVKVKGG